MALHLDDSRLSDLRHLSETLLSPLDHPDTAAWCRSVLQAADRLCLSDRSMMTLPRAGGIAFHSETLPPAAMEKFRSLPARMGQGRIQVRQREMERVLAARRNAGMEIWSNETLHELVGVPMEETPFFHEVMVPAGVVYGRGLTTSLPAGEAWLSLAYSDPERDPFGETAGLQLLGLVLPSFRAGTGMLVRLERRRHSLAAALDSLGLALAVYGLDGTELHRTPDLSELLRADSQSRRVSAAMAETSTALASLRRGESKTASGFDPAHPNRTIRTAQEHYRIQGALLGSDVIRRNDAVVVHLESVGPRLPSLEDLRGRYGLTGREAEITLLLARGASNRRIARRLSISPHTVATHTESIFRKLGIRTRKGLGLRLMRQSGPDRREAQCPESEVGMAERPSGRGRGRR